MSLSKRYSGEKHNTFDKEKDLPMSVFPDIITKLPEARLGIDGLKIYISHSDTHEVWFLETVVDVDYPAHAHKSQWSSIVAGLVEVTINGKTKVCKKGDSYYLPEGVEHKIKMYAGYAEIIYLDDPDFLGK